MDGLWVLGDSRRQADLSRGEQGWGWGNIHSIGWGLALCTFLSYLPTLGATSLSVHPPTSLLFAL